REGGGGLKDPLLAGRAGGPPEPRVTGSGGAPLIGAPAAAPPPPLSGPREAPAPFVHQCHLGFDLVGAPIWHGDELVGFFFTGGSWKQEPGPTGKQDLLRKVREFAELDGDDAGDAITAVPRLTDAELERLKDLIAYGAWDV